MHLIDGEHGHECSCSGGCGAQEHTHEHTHTHSHPHTHDHEHAHSHDHEGGACQGDCCGKEKPANEQEALLDYMLTHNRHHAAELAEVAKQLRADGKDEAAVQIEHAVEDFEKGNMRLSVALSLVK